MKIMVSACLLGDNVKYNGKNNYQEDLVKFLKNHEIIKICPEVLGGLSIPRSPSEIKDDRVINKNYEDVTKEFVLGSEKALDIAKLENIKVAILKANSPSCGSGYIYDGTFHNKLIEGDGKTAELLKRNGITILNEKNYKEYKW